MRSECARALIGVAFLAVLTGGVAEAQRPPKIPHPSLDSADPAVRRQIVGFRERLDTLLEKGARSAEARAALQTMGEVYLAYDLLDASEACFLAAEEGGGREFQTAYLLGYLNERRGDLEAAETWLEKAVDRQADSPAALVRLGKVLLARSKTAAAVPNFERAFAADGTCAAALYGLGEAARLDNRHGEAIERLSAALKLRPDLTQARYALGLSLRQLGRVDEARKQLEQLDLRRVSLSGDNWEGCQDPVLAEVRRKSTGFSIHLVRGADAYFRGDLETELVEYAAAVELEPDDPIAQKSLAAALLRNGTYEAAARHYREAIRLDPTDPVYRFDLAETLRQLGHLDEALDLYSSAVDLYPEFGRAHLVLAEIAIQQGRFEDALHHSEGMLAQQPEHQRARVQRALSLARLGHREEALLELGQLMDDYPPEDPEERLNLSSLLMLLGDLERAFRHFEAILESGAPDPLRARAQLRIGQIQRQRGAQGARADGREQPVERHDR